MEEKLKKLFDYQKFARNKHLEIQIDDALSQCEYMPDELLQAVTGGKKENDEKKEDKNS